MEDALLGKDRGSAIRRNARSQMRSIPVAGFRSTVTDVIGEQVGFPVAVIAATDDPVRLARRLTRRWHGSWRPSPPGCGEPFRRDDVDPSDVRYEILSFEERWMGRRPYPGGVSFESGTLRVDVPAVAPTSELDTYLGLALNDSRFDILAREPAKVQRRHATGLPTEIGPRYSRASNDAPRSFALVDNIYAYRPRDFPALVAAVALAAEGLALRHGLASRTYRHL